MNKKNDTFDKYMDENILYKPIIIIWKNGWKSKSKLKNQNQNQNQK